MEELKFIVETSARHIHVTQETLDYLMLSDEEIAAGKHAELEVRNPLSQPGQFASNTRLDIVGPVNHSWTSEKRKPGRSERNRCQDP